MENILVLWVIFAVMSIAACVPVNYTGLPCRYSIIRNGLKADCSRRSLTAIPKNITTETTSLDVNENLLSNLTTSSFRGLNRLSFLNLQTNNVSDRIERGAFDPLINLVSLSLSENNISSLPSGLFSKNQKLQVIDLSGNRLVSFPIDALKHIGSLRVITVQYNHITNVNFTGFKSRNISKFMLTTNRLSKLREEDFLPLKDSQIGLFDLTYNNLSVLRDGVFKHLCGVVELGLIRNRLKNFSVLPYLGMSSLKELNMGHNFITSFLPIPPSFNQTYLLPPVEHINLQSNKMKTIPSHAFWGLTKLKRLDIHGNRIRYLQNSSFKGLDSLEILDLTGNTISHITSNMLSTFCPRLQSLLIPGHHLDQLNISQFGGLMSLTKLNLARGNIRFIKTPSIHNGWNMPSLQSLDLSYNRLIRLDQNSFYGMTNLTTLIISHMPIYTVENGAFASNDRLRELHLVSLMGLGSTWTPFSNLHELTTLDLSDTSMRKLTFKFFTGLGNLWKLRMRNCDLSPSSFWDNDVPSRPSLSNLSRLNYLYLKSNSLNGLIPGTFNGLQSIETLNLESCKIQNLHENIFQNLTTLKFLKLDDNLIKEVTSEHFKDLISLLEVSIKRNEIKVLPADVFSANKHILYLYISHNHLTTIKEKTILPKRKLDISYNPFGCNCELSWFMKWIEEESVSIEHPEKTNCSQASLYPFQNRPLLEFDPVTACGPQVIVIVISMFAIVTCAAVCIVAYQRRWLINYKCFHLKLVFLRKRDEHDGRERLDYEYDINIAFDDEDEDWVRETFKAGLDERLPDFDRIVCGNDDLPLGMFYIDAITEVIEQSYKSILIISRRAVENHSFINKLRLAVAHMNEVELEKTILIFKEEIPDGHLPYLVRLFLSKNKPYFRWSEDVYGQRLMWEKLVRELGHNKKMNDVLPI